VIALRIVASTATWSSVAVPFNLDEEDATGETKFIALLPEKL
jgi:hypothetical protein